MNRRVGDRRLPDRRWLPLRWLEGEFVAEDAGQFGGLGEERAVAGVQADGSLGAGGHGFLEG